MQFRTDLALEQKEMHSHLPEGVTCEETKNSRANITKISITNEQGAKALEKPIGKYITIEVPPFSDNLTDYDMISVAAESLCELLPKQGSVLVVGLGNRDITPDALGPKTASRVLATRQIEKEIARVADVDSVRSIAVISPGVLGQTGIEAFDLICGITGEIQPDAVIIIDALASRFLKRLGCTVQMSDSGIEPGAGVGNARLEISKKTLGVPVIALGVPTVVDASTLVYDLTNGSGSLAEPDGQQMIVTPREIDLLIERAATMIAGAINKALHPNLESSLIAELLG